MGRYPITVAAFLARSHGLAALKALLDEPKVKVVALYTHRYEPRSQIERKDYPEYLACAKEYHLPFQTIDHPKEMKTLNMQAELIFSVNWRYRFSKELLENAPLGGINIHRGALPQYKGAEPVKRALEAGEKQVVVCAHQMIEEIDAGPVVARAIHDVVRMENEGLEEATDRIREEITPLFALLVREICEEL